MCAGVSGHRQIRARQTGAGQIRARQIGAGQIGARQIGARQIGARQIGARPTGLQGGRVQEGSLSRRRGGPARTGRRPAPDGDGPPEPLR